jgi:hypothetical protein
MLAASNVVNSTAIPAQTTYVAGEAIGAAAIAADSTKVYAQFDITDTDGHLETMTAGEIRIWMEISRADERQRIVA